MLDDHDHFLWAKQQAQERVHAIGQRLKVGQESEPAQDLVRQDSHLQEFAVELPLVETFVLASQIFEHLTRRLQGHHEAKVH